MTGSVDGVRLYEHAGGREWTPIQHDAWKKPWIAHPEPVAVALMAASEVLDAVGSFLDNVTEWMGPDPDELDEIRQGVMNALDALGAAQQEATDA